QYRLRPAGVVGGARRPLLGGEAAHSRNPSRPRRRPNPEKRRDWTGGTGGGPEELAVRPVVDPARSRLEGRASIRNADTRADGFGPGRATRRGLARSRRVAEADRAVRNVSGRALTRRSSPPAARLRRTRRRPLPHASSPPAAA